MTSLSSQQQCHPHPRGSTTTLKFLLSRWTKVYTSSSPPCAVSGLQSTLQGGLCSKGMYENPLGQQHPTGPTPGPGSPTHAHVNYLSSVQPLNWSGKMFKLTRIVIIRQLLAMPCSELEPATQQGWQPPLKLPYPKNTCTSQDLALGNP